MLARLSVLVLACFVAWSCDEDDAAVDPFVGCPNDMPATGAECPRAGLVCHYFSGCNVYDEARCETDSRWVVTPGCTASQGGATAASTSASSTASSSASTASSSASTASSGGMGGSGGG